MLQLCFPPPLSGLACPSIFLHVNVTFSLDGDLRERRSAYVHMGVTEVMAGFVIVPHVRPRRRRPQQTRHGEPQHADAVCTPSFSMLSSFPQVPPETEGCRRSKDGD
jgi:hypothetical protein